MISGVWVVNTRVESRQDNTAITNAMDRIAVSTVPSSPPRKRALQDMQVDETNVYGSTNGMTHVAALDSGGRTGCDLIPVRRICRSYRLQFTPENIYDQP